MTHLHMQKLAAREAKRYVAYELSDATQAEKRKETRLMEAYFKGLLEVLQDIQYSRATRSAFFVFTYGHHNYAWAQEVDLNFNNQSQVFKGVR